MALHAYAAETSVFRPFSVENIELKGHMTRKLTVLFFSLI